MNLIFFVNVSVFFLFAFIVVAERLSQLQYFRKQMLQEQCQRYKQDDFKGPQNWEDLSPSAFQNFIVDEKHGSIYCYIPKVMCEQPLIYQP